VSWEQSEGGESFLSGVPQLKGLVAGFSSHRPGCDRRVVHLGFMVDKVALGQVFHRSFPFILPIVTLQVNHVHRSFAADITGCSTKG
jgi:hypothetical protein